MPRPNPFAKIPNRKFQRRLLLLELGVLFFGLVLTGWVSTQVLPDGTIRWRALQRASSPSLDSVVYPLFVSEQSGVEGLGVLYRRMVFYGFHFPQACSSANAVSTFQEQRCQEMRGVIPLEVLVAGLPFVLTFFTYLYFMGSLAKGYRQGWKQVQNSKPIGQGIVTEPARLPQDRTAYFYCMMRISVEKSGEGVQIDVYLPDNVPVPRPGEKLDLYEWGEYFGKKRLTGALHAPHMAILGA